MIFHKYKCIFIHIPKCAGSSINSYLSENINLNWRKANYDFLYGWCPDRRVHMQHVTAKQMLELELVTYQDWNNYYKFTFIRNPWDRAYSDYLWMKRDNHIEGDFMDYITMLGEFKNILRNKDKKGYRGDHLLKQSAYFDMEGKYQLDFVGRFENLNSDFQKVKEALHLKKPFIQHLKKTNNRFNDYSKFYTDSTIKIVQEKYKEDIVKFKYTF